MLSRLCVINLPDWRVAQRLCRKNRRTARCNSVTRQNFQLAELANGLQTHRSSNIYRATRMHSADYAVARCPSVHPSVCLSHAGILSKGLYISSKFYSPSGSSAIVVFLYQTGWQYSDGDSLTGASNARGLKKSRFSTNISLNLAHDALISALQTTISTNLRAAKNDFH